jgi:hypothetical protein
VVLPDAIALTRGSRVVELEEGGAHVASITQLLRLLQRERVRETDREAQSPVAASGSSSDRGRDRGSDRGSDRGRQSQPQEERSSRRASSRDSIGSLASQSQSASSMSGGWPAWVLDSEREIERDRDSERVAAVQAAHAEREAVKARQARLREAVVQGERRAVTAALRHHPDDVRAPYAIYAMLVRRVYM